jgi:SPP1 family predicted phage head-tail adaptor
MKCCDIQVGDLRVPITIEKKTRTADAMGGYVETWAADPKGTIWAKMQMLTGTERWEAMRVQPRNR